MRLNIRRSGQAKLDQTDIWLTIAEDNMRAADGVYERINDAITMLSEHPEAGRAREDLQPGLRYFPVGSYLVFYTVRRRHAWSSPHRAWRSRYQRRPVR